MVPDEISTLEEAVDAFNMGKDKESEGKFDQSDTAALACIEKNRSVWGMSDDQILAHIGTQSDTSRTTMYGRLLVGRVFNKHWREDNDWCRTKHWSHFEVCARQWTEDDPEAPVEWLKYCVDNDLSVRRLKSEIALANGGPPKPDRPVYILDAAPCTLVSMDQHQMSVLFEHEITVADPIPPGIRLVVTAVIEPELAAMPTDPPTA